MTDLRRTRSIHTATSKKLRRARYLFIFLHRKYLHTCSDHQLKLFAERMKAYGLYAQTTLDSDTRWHVLRRLWRVYNPQRLKWSEWIARRKWRKIA